MISYEPFFRTPGKKGVTSYRLGKMGFPMTTCHAMRKGKHNSTQTVDALCALLACNVKDILEYKPNPKKQRTQWRQILCVRVFCFFERY